MDEKQFKIMIEKLNEISSHLDKNNWYNYEMKKLLERINRYERDAKYDTRTKSVSIKDTDIAPE